MRRDCLLMAAVLAGAGLVMGLGRGASGALRDDPRSIDQKAGDALAAGRFEAASKFLQMFIESSVGDPRMGKAEKELRECTAALAKEWAGDGREADAAKLYLWLGSDAGISAEAKEGFAKQASQAMTAGMADAKQKKQYARALQLHKDWVGLFPSKADGYTEQDLETFAMEGLSAAAQDRFNLMDYPEMLEQFYPGGGAPDAELTKKNKNEPLVVSYYRTLGDLGWSGRLLADYQGLAKDAPARSNQVFNNQVEKAAVDRAQAWASQGNVAGTLEALATAKDLTVTESKNATLKQIEGRFTGKASEPQKLTFSGTVQGKVGWQDAGTGYEAKDVSVDDGGDVTVKGGFLLDGGRIELQKAQMHLKGTAAQPVVFRNVTVILNPGAVFEAEGAVFINCTFGRTGEIAGMHHVTHWSFLGCLVYRSKFESLSQNGFQLRFGNSAWVESTLPERALFGNDLAGAYTNGWNDVSNCLFFRTKMAPSTVWMGKQCDYVRCPIAQDSGFDSKTALNVTLFIPEGDPMLGKLRARTLVSDAGSLRYGVARKAFDVGVPALFWNLLPVEGPEMKATKADDAPKGDAKGDAPKGDGAQ